jgi:hypothetical protein
MGLWLYAFRVLKTTCNPHCIFGTSNYKLWWIISDLQFLGDLATDDDPSWATDDRATVKQRDRCKGRKESLWKETDALDPDEHLDAIALILEPPASCCVCLFVWGGGVHYFIIKSVIPSICISSLVVLNMWRRRRHGAFHMIFSMYMLKFAPT